MYNVVVPGTWDRSRFITEKALLRYFELGSCSIFCEIFKNLKGTETFYKWKNSETGFGFPEYFLNTWYAQKPKRFVIIDFGNRKCILAYPFGYQLSFSGNISFREYPYGF